MINYKLPDLKKFEAEVRLAREMKLLDATMTGRRLQPFRAAMLLLTVTIIFYENT